VVERKDNNEFKLLEQFLLDSQIVTEMMIRVGQIQDC